MASAGRLRARPPPALSPGTGARPPRHGLRSRRAPRGGAPVCSHLPPAALGFTALSATVGDSRRQSMAARCPPALTAPGGRDRDRPSPRRKGGRRGPGPTGRCSNPLPATAAAEAAGTRRERRGTATPEAGRGRGPGPPLAAAAAMGWEEKQVRGYPEFVRTAQSYHGRPIFALFCGDKDAAGRSWCPDCVTGEARGARRGGRDPRRAAAVAELDPPRGPRCSPGPAPVPGPRRPPGAASAPLPRRGRARARPGARRAARAAAGAGCSCWPPSAVR